MRDFLTQLGLSNDNFGASYGTFVPTGGDWVESISPVDCKLMGRVKLATAHDYDAVMAKVLGSFDKWRQAPAPVRGEVVRQIGNALRENKAALGQLVSLEMGKILAEGEGEVQEMIDIADFAV